jgi:hypothetical protein
MKNPARHPDGLDGKQTRGSRSGGLGIVLTSIGGAGLSERSGDPTVFWRAVHRFLRRSPSDQIIQDMAGDLVRYSYKPPLTGHEAANVVFLVFSFVLAILGIIAMPKGASKDLELVNNNIAVVENQDLKIC